MSAALPVLTTTEVALVENSFRTLVPAAPAVAEVFYRRLFQRDPALRGLFHGDLREQGRKFMAALGHVVAHAHALASIEALLREWGARHAGYGVRREHFAVVGEALMDTFRGLLGAAFSAEIEAAWRRFYGLIADQMLRALQAAETPAGVGAAA